jgi:sugar phosphate isomerase/epimerase
VNLGQGVHLTYCSNIHPGESWDAVRANLERHVPVVRSQVAPGQPFGIGLRLSAEAARGLATPAALAELREFLDANALYVFTLNGFAHGNFHGSSVKEAVYLPDWQSAERLDYTNALADILAGLLPALSGLEGSVSTAPGAFKAEVKGAPGIETMRRQLVSHAGHLVALEQRSGKRITLALEPEPCCFLETVDEAVQFFERQLFGAASVAQLAASTGLASAAAAEALRSHLGLCLDLCHAAVEFEDPDDCLLRLHAAGIRILKLQISAGLCVTRFDPASIATLRTYVEPVYLHQVVERAAHGLRRFTDLPEALGSLDTSGERDEWRVHFHVPVFQKDLGALSSSRDFVEAMLSRHKVQPISGHLEVETYTWDVLPPPLRLGSVDQMIARELNWVMKQLAP